jgi:hypothetical protein
MNPKDVLQLWRAGAILPGISRAEEADTTDVAQPQWVQQWPQRPRNPSVRQPASTPPLVSLS